MQPLEGIRVLEFCNALYGGLTTQLLGDFGADVIKVEPLEGDFFRITRKRPAGRDSTRWLGVNRSKRSICLNLKTEPAKKMAMQLAQQTDIIVHNYRPGVMDRLGVGFDAVKAVNPRVIYCNLWGFGGTGPLAKWASGDFWVQAMGGVVESQGTKDGPPYLAGPPMADQGGPAIAVYGIMLALRARDKTGEGQEVDTSLLNAIIFLQSSQMTDYLVDGRLVGRGGRGWAGAFPMGAYPTKDGAVTPFFSGDDQWPIFCKTIGLEHVGSDPRFKSEELREERREELYVLLDQAFRKKTRAEWVAAFKQARLRCDPCLNYAELFAHPQVAANEMVLELDHPTEGKMRLVHVPVKLKATPATPKIPPPLLGQHTAEVLKDLGYSLAQIQEFQELGVVGGVN